MAAGQDTESELDKAYKKIKVIFPELPKEAISPSPVAGLYQIKVPPKLLYISADAKYVVEGDLINTKTFKNESTPVRDGLRNIAIDNFGEKNMIVYGDKKLPHTVTVFTDIDCGYCRKLHSEIENYNKEGIRVRYMAYPRAGIGSESFVKAESVWCAEDRNKALTQAKMNGVLEPKKCTNPVAKEYQLGQMLGIQGTPAIITQSGEVIPGYVPPKQLKKILAELKVK
jgi:thiol:disulfide interchange protein DsbC